MTDSTATDIVTIEPTNENTDPTLAEPQPAKKPRKKRVMKVRYGARELLVLQMLSQGVSYQDIAVELGVSLDTIKGHLKRVYKKLGAKSGPHAVSIAIGRGMIPAQGPIELVDHP